MEEITLAEIMELVVIPIITTIMGYLAGKGLIKVCIHKNGEPTN